MLTNGEIIFEDFQPVITIPQHHRRTDNLQWQYWTLRGITR